MGKLSLKRPTRSVAICLDGDLLAEYEELNRELVEERRAAVTDKRVNNPELRKLEKRHAELYEAQAENTAEFKLRALRRDEWDALKDQNPPRKDNEEDKQLGYNPDALVDAVMAADGVIESVTLAGELVDFTAKDWAELSKDMTEAQYFEFQKAVIELHSQNRAVPFSSAGYAKTQRSGEKSK